MLKNVDSVYEYEKQLQERLQNRYDRICSMLVECSALNKKEGYKEYLWRKHELEETSRALGIKLLKTRSFEDINRMVCNLKKTIIHKGNEIPEDSKPYLVKNDLGKYYVAVYEYEYGWKDAHSYKYISHVVAWKELEIDMTDKDWENLDEIWKGE